MQYEYKAFASFFELIIEKTKNECYTFFMEKNLEAYFVYATNNTEYFVRRVHTLSPNNEELKEFYDYLAQNNVTSSDNHGSVWMSTETNVLSMLVEPFWSLFTKEEKIDILKSAMKKFGGKSFDDCKEFGVLEDSSIAPIYTDGEHIYLNTTALNYKVSPCFYLSSILSAKYEALQAVYESRNEKVHNIIEIENIQELKTRFVLSHLDMQATEEEQKEWLESFYADMPLLRARNYAILDAVEMLLDEADTLRPVSNQFIDETFDCAEHVLSDLRTIHSTLDARGSELARIQKIDTLFHEDQKGIGAINYMNFIRSILKKSDRRRDAWYVLEVNHLLNSDSKKDGRNYDIVSQEKALYHFGLNMSDVEMEDEQENLYQTDNEFDDGFDDEFVDGFDYEFDDEFEDEKDDEQEEPDDDGPYYKA